MKTHFTKNPFTSDYDSFKTDHIFREVLSPFKELSYEYIKAIDLMKNNTFHQLNNLISCLEYHPKLNKIARRVRALVIRDHMAKTQIFTSKPEIVSRLKRYSSWKNRIDSLCEIELDIFEEEYATLLGMREKIERECEKGIKNILIHKRHFPLAYTTFEDKFQDKIIEQALNIYTEYLKHSEGIYTIFSSIQKPYYPVFKNINDENLLKDEVIEDLNKMIEWLDEQDSYDASELSEKIRSKKREEFLSEEDLIAIAAAYETLSLK